MRALVELNEDGELIFFIVAFTNGAYLAVRGMVDAKIAGVSLCLLPYEFDEHEVAQPINDEDEMREEDEERDVAPAEQAHRDIAGEAEVVDGVIGVIGVLHEVDTVQHRRVQDGDDHPHRHNKRADLRQLPRARMQNIDEQRLFTLTHRRIVALIELLPHRISQRQLKHKQRDPEQRPEAQCQRAVTRLVGEQTDNHRRGQYQAGDECGHYRASQK